MLASSNPLPTRAPGRPAHKPPKNRRVARRKCLAQSDARPSAHSVTLSWKASTSPGVVGYNVYRRDKASSAFGKINQKPIVTTSCIDYFVELRHKYYYYVVAADHLAACGASLDSGTRKIA